MDNGQQITPAQRAEANVQKDQINSALGGLQKLLSGLGGHKAVVKALEELGIKPIFMPVMLPGSDEAADCLVVDVEELLLKEYAHMTGVNVREMLNKND
jgi:hypothetical protein